MDKRLLFPKNNGRERDIFFVKEDRLYLQKHASAYHPKVQDYISKAKPVENLIQVLLTALGGWPFWPQNVNGDRFPVSALEHDGDDYGHKTFATNANYFVHHINKDPALAKGKVMHAVWNEKAKRVELVIGIDPSLDADAARSIENGEDLAFSMGAKLPFDVCSICGNKARTRMEYCDHLRYQMNQIDPVSGMLVGAVNPFPKFFDISRVLIPADKTAYMWEKIASAASPISRLGSAELAEIPAKYWSDDQYLTSKIAMRTESWDEKRSANGSAKASSKLAAVSKNATITKNIPVASVKPLFVEKMKKLLPATKALLDASSPDLDMSQLKGFSLAQIISTLLALGIVPKASESEELFKLFAGASNQDPSAFGPHAFNSELAKRLIHIMPERSFARPILVRRIILLSKKTAPELRKLSAEGPHESFHAGLAAGILAAALAYSGNKTLLGNLIQEHPFLATILGAGAIRAFRKLGPSTPVTTGQYSLAEPGAPLYNTDWQRRFAEAQARPVTVIKTGSDLNSNLFDDIFGGIPFLFAIEGASQCPAIQFLENNPYNFNGSMMTKESSAVGQEISDLLTSARRFMKSASLENLDFLEAVPQSSRNSVWDLAILDAAEKTTRKLR